MSKKIIKPPNKPVVLEENPNQEDEIREPPGINH